MPSAVFRFDASPTIGAGHAMRSLVLADELAASGWDVRLLVTAETLETVPAIGERDYRVMALNASNWNDPQVAAASFSGCDVLVLDHYELDATYERTLRGRAGAIVVIDDLADRPHDCDILLDQTAGREEADYAGLINPASTLLLGSDYALIRKEFITHTAQALARRMGATEVKNVLVSFGYTDPSNATSAALTALMDWGFDVTVAIGSRAPHLAEVQALAKDIGARVVLNADNMAALMVNADLAIGAAGSTSWERCCLGLPSIAVVTGADQVYVAKALQQHNAALVVEAGQITTALKKINGQALQTMTNAAVKLCDGGGAERVAQKIEEIVKKKDQNRG